MNTVRWIDIANKIKEVNEERMEKKKKIKGARIHELSEDRHFKVAIGYIYRYGEVKVAELVDKLKIHVKDYEDILKVFERFRLIDRIRDIIRITGEGERIAEELGYRFKIRDKGGEYLSLELREKLLSEIDKFIKQLPPPDPHLFQWYFTPDSTIEIINYMIENFDIEGKNICCLMTPIIGLSLHIINKEINGKSEIWVFDADDRVVDYLRDCDANAKRYDISNPIPEEYKGYFDTVIIDPPYHEDFYYVSLSRAVDLVGGRKDKVIYCVVPPPEIAYLRKPSFPPLINAVISLLDMLGLQLVEIRKGICQYQSPPYEISVLLKRLNINKEEMNILTNWRRSDLLRLTLFRDVTSPLPGDVELPSYERDYERYKRRFLVKMINNMSYDGCTYSRPDVEIKEANRWDEFLENGEFVKGIFPPYYVLIYDIGDWDDYANKLIKLKGYVAHYIWQKIKSGELPDSQFIDTVSFEIKQIFSQAPNIDQIKEDVESFIQKLKELKLI